MTPRRWLLAQVVLLGMLGVFAFPGEGLALRPTFLIQLTPSGPSPSALTMFAGEGSVFFTNPDTLTHTFAFANGWCSAELAAGASQSCGIPQYVGDYTYTVDGTTQADIAVEPLARSVSLAARSHSIRRGSVLRLHGRLQNAFGSPPNAGSPQPIVVFGRAEPCPRFWGCAYHQIAVVRATVHPRTKRAPFGELLWQLRVRPSTSMTFIAEANYQPKGGQVWEQAWSKPFHVNIRW